MKPLGLLRSRSRSGGGGASAPASASSGIGIFRSATAMLSLLAISSLLPSSVNAECKYLHTNITETMVMREFLFVAGTTDCINVRVYWSDEEPDSNDVYGSLDPDKWELMCDSDVMGMGAYDHTVLPADDCFPVPVTAGDTIWFYFGIESIDPGNCTGPGGTLTYDIMRTESTVYGFCPANNTATLPFVPQEPLLGSQGGGSPTTLAPQPAPATSAPQPAPVSAQTAPPATATPTSSPSVPTTGTSTPTVSRAPVTDRPTRHPITAKPTGSDRLTISVPTDTPGGYIDPSGEISVDPGSSVTFTFFPQICLEEDTVATGILYGHFDADYMAGFDYAEFPITYTEGEGPGTGNTGSYSYPTGTDAHDHEYDEDCDCVFVDYIRPSASMERMEDIMRDNILEDDAFTGDEDAANVEKDNLVFKLIAANGDINTAGFFVINDVFNHYDPTTFHSVVTWDDKEVEDLPMLTWGDPTDPGWNPAMTDQALRDQVIHVDEIAMGYKYDAIRRGKGGILPTNTGDMKGNEPGQYNEWRNGALTMQVVKVDPVDGTFHCTMRPEWSNASVPILEGDPDFNSTLDPCNQKRRSPQGPVDWCPPGYNVLYEGTLFWHWSGSCDGGSSSYHEADWEADYHAFFNSDCTDSDPAAGACIFHELCWVILDGEAVCLNDANQLTLSDIDDHHEIEAFFAAKIEGQPSQCPPPPSPAPTISHAPTVSFSPTESPTTQSPTSSPTESPTLSPTVSHAPTINQFRKDVEAAQADTSLVGNCWRWAHTFSCYPGDNPTTTCRVVEGPDAVDITKNAITSQEVSSDFDKCCPVGTTFASAPDVGHNCIEFEVFDSSGDLGDQCVDYSTRLTSADGKIIKTGADFTFGDTGQNGADQGFGVKISISDTGVCSQCYLHYAEAFAYQTNKGEAPYNHCPGDPQAMFDADEVFGTDYSSFSTATTVKKLYKDVYFGFKGDKQKVPFAFAAGLWCGMLNVDNDHSGNNGCGGIQSNDYVIQTIG